MELETVAMGKFIVDLVNVINQNFSNLQLNKANLTDVITKTSQLTNDAGFQTAAEVEAAVAALVNAAPEALDTLKELADALNNDPDFAATVTTALAGKVDKEEGKGLYPEADKTKLAGIAEGANNYTLPVAGAELGGVKNGGNVVVNADGTLTAPTGGGGTAEVTRVNFTADDSRWSGPVEGVYTLTADTAGKSPMGVYRKKGEAYGAVLCNVELSSQQALVSSFDRFEGYLLLI